MNSRPPTPKANALTTIPRRPPYFEKNNYKLGRGEICVENFIPPANSTFWAVILSKSDCFLGNKGENGLAKTALAAKCEKLFGMAFCSLILHAVHLST